MFTVPEPMKTTPLCNSTLKTVPSVVTLSKWVVAHDGNNRSAGGEAHALVRPNTRGGRRIETEVTVMVGPARNQVPHWNREITLDAPCGINAGPGIGVGAPSDAVVNVGGHDGSPVFLHFAVEIGSGRGNVGRGLGLDDRKLGLIKRVMIKADALLSFKLPNKEPSGYSKTKLIEAVVATIGVPEITPEEGLTVKPSGNPKAAKPDGEPVATMV